MEDNGINYRINDNISQNNQIDGKLDLKNIALKIPKSKNNTLDGSFWKIFWISNIPKRECISDIKREYSQIIKNMENN